MVIEWGQAQSFYSIKGPPYRAIRIYYSQVHTLIDWMFSCSIDYYLFARRNAGFQNDARRKEREMKRNRRMTKTLASISVTFAISWLPYHTFFILTDTFSLWQGYVRYVYIKYILCSPYVMSFVKGSAQETPHDSWRLSLHCHDIHFHQPSYVWMV